MAQLYEYMKMALDNIRANKGRSFLTMLGIIIGISSVIMIMSIGGGAKAEMSDALNAIAGGQIYIYSNTDGGYGSHQRENSPCEGRNAFRQYVWQYPDAERHL